MKLLKSVIAKHPSWALRLLPCVIGHAQTAKSPYFRLVMVVYLCCVHGLPSISECCVPLWYILPDYFRSHVNVCTRPDQRISGDSNASDICRMYDRPFFAKCFQSCADSQLDVHRVRRSVICLLYVRPISGELLHFVLRSMTVAFTSYFWRLYVLCIWCICGLSFLS